MLWTSRQNLYLTIKFCYQDLSKSNNFFLRVTPPGLENPPIVPSDLITLWHGIANTILFLLSNEGNYITGTEIIVDGGLTAKS